MNFASDNWAGAHPRIAEALVAHAHGFAAAYGTSELDRRVERKFCEIFERDVAVFFVGTGTAANALAMTLVNRPGGVVFCHPQAHCFEDECGAPEYFTGGARLHPVEGPLGRIAPENLEPAMRHHPAALVHAGQPMAVTITQATEVGTLYDPAHIEAIAGICRSAGLPLHMDGARFANALTSLGTTPADMTWKRGVDIVSFGGTKNGCWCAEAIVVLDPAGTEALPFLRKRAAHLFSKSRFIAAQFDAYFRDDLWLETARHANAMAARLAGHIEASEAARLAWEPGANEVFAVMGTDAAERFRKKGATFHQWKPPSGSGDLTKDGESLFRFVTSFATTPDEVDAFGALLKG